MDTCIEQCPTSIRLVYTLYKLIVVPVVSDVCERQEDPRPGIRHAGSHGHRQARQ